MRMKLAWIANVMEDLVFEFSQIARDTRNKYEQGVSKHFKHLNQAMNIAHYNKVSIRIPKIDYVSLRTVAYSDSALAKNSDLSFQLGHIDLLIKRAVPVS